jgi:beta-lactamase superfamily II metal-dependent hydrolase
MYANVVHFDVDHGDSAVIEIIEGTQKFYIVIDSNYSVRGGKKIIPALEYLKKVKATEVAAVFITHLHADHYLGIEEILESLPIKKIVIPPFLSDKDAYTAQISNLQTKIAELVERSPDPEIGNRAYALARIISFISNNEHLVEPSEGPETIFRIAGISQPIGRIFLPLKRYKGIIRDILKNGTFELDTFKGMNECSVVFCLELCGKKILFGADGTLDQWKKHQEQQNRAGVKNLEITTMKAPHHGSRHNNTADNYSYLLKEDSQNQLIVSANGKTHPHDELFQLINDYKLEPYCTHLAKQCMGNMTDIGALAKLPREFRSILANYDIEGPGQVCQGDIAYEISPGGITFSSSAAGHCLYRQTKPATLRAIL